MSLTAARGAASIRGSISISRPRRMKRKLRRRMSIPPRPPRSKRARRASFSRASIPKCGWRIWRREGARCEISGRPPNNPAANKVSKVRTDTGTGPGLKRARAASAKLGHVAASGFLADLKVAPEILEVRLDQREAAGEIEEQDLVGAGHRRRVLDDREVVVQAFCQFVA